MSPEERKWWASSTWPWRMDSFFRLVLEPVRLCSSLACSRSALTRVALTHPLRDMCPASGSKLSVQGALQSLVTAVSCMYGCECMMAFEQM